MAFYDILGSFNYYIEAYHGFYSHIAMLIASLLCS